MKTRNSLEVKGVVPVYGVNYKRGYVGFTYYREDFVSRGIAYFTRWGRMSDVKVSHTFLAACKGDLIEAHAAGGVQLDHIAKYFDDPKCQVFFRKPRGLTDDIADRLIQTAARQVGDKYDMSLILAQAMQGLYLGRVIRKLFGDKPDELVSRLFDSADEWICSELMSYILDEQPEYRDKGILAEPTNTIDPQELFGDSAIFEPWKCGPEAPEST